LKNNLNTGVLEKLAWPILVQQLAEFCQSEEAGNKARQLQPNLRSEAASARWHLLAPLKELVILGYRAPIGQLSPFGQVFKAATVGQMLDGQELRSILGLVLAVERVFSFVCDFSSRCVTLEGFRERLYPLPKLSAAIARAIDADGSLFDDASQELAQIRRNKRGLRKKIEEDLHRLITGNEFEQYLQDDFFTVRSERYVVPIRLDGRGRIKGSILDTSASGQTLYIEPAQIASQNEQLQELDIAEKLEIIRIFRELSSMVAKEVVVLKRNHEELIELDLLSAQAEIACRQGAGMVKIAKVPGVDLRAVRHPLILRADGNLAVENDISVCNDRKILVISGPNAGGKTVVLETVGIVHLMAKAGLLIPADPASSIYFFDNILLEMGDAQNLAENLSTFSGHVLGLKRILERVCERDLVLLDELAVGTEPLTGAAIAQAILESLADKKAVTFATTHYDNLKGLAVSDPRFRNGSMEFSLRSLKPTYKLILDLPGQSYGLEVAEEMGLDAKIIERAKSLRGETATSLDRAVSDLMLAREDSLETKKTLDRQILDAQTEKDRWQREVEALNRTRQKAALVLSERYEEELSQLRGQFNELVREIRKTAKEVARNSGDTEAQEELSKQRQAAEKTMSSFVDVLGKLKNEYADSKELPGNPLDFDALRDGDKVYIISINKEGTVSKKGHQKSDPVEVAIGLLKMRVACLDLRAMGRQKQSVVSTKSLTPPSIKRGLVPDNSHAPQITELVIQTPRNTCDLRGLDLDDAINRMWNSVDAAVLRGDSALVVVHGHGTDRLKTGIRAALLDKPLYEISFRPGNSHEGGDGITVVFLRV
jgi:DNA mismatch repair protein MutS2